LRFLSAGVVSPHSREVIDGIGKKYHSPRKKVDDAELALNGDSLVVWLQEHCPQIVKPLLAARNPRVQKKRFRAHRVDGPRRYVRP
jgi:hypothetical protein